MLPIIDFYHRPWIIYYQVQIIGLKDETLDRLGIQIPLHRTVLQSFGCRQFTNDIEVGKYINMH